jgi:outer membrane lipoprotein-sorting protein
MRLEVRELLKEKGRSFLLILVLLAVLALVGCGSSETKVSADKVVQDALAAQAEVSSSSAEITIVATAKGAIGETNLDVSLDGTVTGDMDWANKKMTAHLGMNAGFNGMTFPVSADMYAFDNITYMQLTMMGNTDNWTKDSLPMDFWFTQENAQFIDNLLQSSEAESLPNEKVGGVNCYVLKLTPDIAAIQQMFSQQSSDEDEMPDMASLISNLSIKVWAAKGTSYVTKIEMELSANIPSEVLGGSAGGEGLDVNLTITMQFSKFNDSVSIQLPAEAQNAEDGFELPFDISSFF